MTTRSTMLWPISARLNKKIHLNPFLIDCHKTIWGVRGHVAGKRTSRKEIQACLIPSILTNEDISNFHAQGFAIAIVNESACKNILGPQGQGMDNEYLAKMVVGLRAVALTPLRGLSGVRDIGRCSYSSWEVFCVCLFATCQGIPKRQEFWANKAIIVQCDRNIWFVVVCAWSLFLFIYQTSLDNNFLLRSCSRVKDCIKLPSQIQKSGADWDTADYFEPGVLYWYKYYTSTWWTAIIVVLRSSDCTLRGVRCRERAPPFVEYAPGSAPLLGTCSVYVLLCWRTWYIPVYGVYNQGSTTFLSSRFSGCPRKPGSKNRNTKELCAPSTACTQISFKFKLC